MQRIPVYSPLFIGNEKKYLQECIDTGWVSSDGPFVQRFEEAFAEWSGNRYAIAVCNGTAALETAIWAMDIQDEIAIPTGTIISCALAAFNNCIKIKLYDGESGVFNNLMRCHLFGKWQDGIGNKIVDDCSQYWKPYKTSGASCYSLYANKLITCGEGGIITTNNDKVYYQARNYRNLCHSEERFVHNYLGYNFRMSNLQAAVALAQLECIDKFTEIKQRNRDLYKKHIQGVEILFDVEVPWMYLVKSKHNAKKVTDRLIEQGIDCRRYFCPLHKQPCLKFDTQEKFTQAEDMWEHAFYLPSGLALTEKEIVQVCKTLKSTLDFMI